jgi:DnaJ-class molecular chaperone
MVICSVCEGSKIIKEVKTGDTKLCPKCAGKGSIQSIKEEKESKTKTLMHD